MKYKTNIKKIRKSKKVEKVNIITVLCQNDTKKFQ